jgi:hypothetical protein
MKYLITTIMCLLIVGCVAKGPCCQSNVKGKNASKHVEKNRKASHGDALGNRLDAAHKRIQKAVEEGKMTPEEGKEMMSALKKKVREGRKNR